MSPDVLPPDEVESIDNWPDRDAGSLRERDRDVELTPAGELPACHDYSSGKRPNGSPHDRQAGQLRHVTSRVMPGASGHVQHEFVSWLDLPGPGALPVRESDA